MNVTQIRTYAAWLSLGSELFLIALAMIIRLLPREFIPSFITVPLGLTAMAVLVLAGIIGLPRWPAVIALGLYGWFAATHFFSDSGPLDKFLLR
jgi:hypothetical protein